MSATGGFVQRGWSSGALGRDLNGFREISGPRRGPIREYLTPLFIAVLAPRIHAFDALCGRTRSRSCSC